MGYEVRLTGSRAGKVVHAKNPFTGETVDVPTYTLSASDVKAAHAVLARHGGKRKGEAHVVTLPGGAHARVAIDREEGEPGWYVELDPFLQKLGDDETRFLFNLATAGSLVVEGEDIAIATTADVLERMPMCELAATVEESGRALKGEKPKKASPKPGPKKAAGKPTAG